MLMMNKGLKVLKLSQNNIGRDVGLDMLDNIKDNITLETLDLSMNLIPLSTLESLTKYVNSTAASKSL